MIARFIGHLIIATAVVAAFMASLAAQRGGGGPQASDNAPTPRLANGHPDLNGWWGGGGGGFAGGRTLADLTDEKGNVYLQLNARSQGSALGTTSGQLAENFERDSGVAQRADPNKPIYKPEFWEKVQALDINGNHEDPTFRCGPPGVPRMGFPNKIVMNPSEVVLLYDAGNTFRWIPINKPHNAERDATYKGDSVAKWDGDTLVVDTTNFNGRVAYSREIPYLSDALHTVERFTVVDDNTIDYEVTIDDPQLFTGPWKVAGSFSRVAKGVESLEFACAEGSQTLQNIFGLPPGK